MFFLPLILFSLFAGSGLFGAQGQQVSIFPMRQYEIKPFSEPITRLLEGSYHEPQSGKNIAFVRAGIGQGSSSYTATLEIPTLLPLAPKGRGELRETLFSSVSDLKSTFRVVGSQNGLSDYVEDNATGARQAISTDGQIMTTYLVTRDKKSLIVGFSHGTVRIYQVGGVRFQSEIKPQPWSAWLWAKLCKPRVYVPLFLLCAAAVCGRYYGKSYLASKIKKLYTK